MSVELKSKENGRAIFTVEVDADKFSDAVQEAYIKNRHMFTLPGFRKGKAPRKIIEANYGHDVFFEDAVNLILQQEYKPALDELELDPVDYPDVDVKGEIAMGQPLLVEFSVDLRPEPELCDYKDMVVKFSEKVVTDDEVNGVIEKERDKNSRLITITDRPSQDGDTLSINFDGYMDGEPFDGGKANNYEVVIGSGTFIPGFEEQLIGHVAEDEFEVNVTFPEDYHDNLKGKDATFKVVVNSVKFKELPELDDEFVKDVSAFDTLDEYRNDVRVKLEDDAEKRNKQEKIAKAMEALVENTELHVPQAMIESQLEQEFQEFVQRVSQMGIDIKTYYGITQSSEDKVKEELRGQAEKRVRGDLILEAFIKAENVEATEQEIDDEIRELGNMYNEQDPEEFLKNFKENEDTSGVEEFIKKRKGLDRLVEVVKYEVE